MFFKQCSRDEPLLLWDIAGMNPALPGEVASGLPRRRCGSDHDSTCVSRVSAMFTN